MHSTNITAHAGHMVSREKERRNEREDNILFDSTRIRRQAGQVTQHKVRYSKVPEKQHGYRISDIMEGVSKEKTIVENLGGYFVYMIE